MLNRLTRPPLLVLSLVVFRVLNSLSIKTHFEPDEYFQSVEVAMSVILDKKVFTWEWFFGLRSFVFVSVFLLPLKAFYYISAYIHRIIRVYSESPGNSDQLIFMMGAPYVVKVMGALIAALGDYSTIGAYKSIYLVNTEEAPVEIVIATLLNLGLWLYSTRTHVNSFESSVSIYILHRILKISHLKEKNTKRISHFISVSISVFLIYIRPTAITNILCAWVYSLWLELRSFDRTWRSKEKKIGSIYKYVYIYLQHSRIISLLNILSGFITVFLCVLIDSIFYKEVVCSTFEFYRINMKYKVSHLFGVLPFVFAPLFLCVILGAYTGMLLFSSVEWFSIQFISPVVYLCIHGLIAHKEMRFLLPILPYLNIIIARNLKSLLTLSPTRKSSTQSFISVLSSTLKKILFSKYVFIGNLLIGILIGIDHQNITRPLDYLRKECYLRLESRNSPVFILSAFNPYMLPMNTYLGHKRIITRTVDNNPNVLSLIENLKVKKRFQSPEYKLRLREFDTVESCMVENILLFGPLDYHYIVLDSKYGPELENSLPEFVKVHESVHKRIPAHQSVSIYKQAFK